MKRLTGSSRWRSGVGVVGVGVMVATLGIGVASALALDGEASDVRTVAKIAQRADARDVVTTPATTAAERAETSTHEAKDPVEKKVSTTKAKPPVTKTHGTKTPEAKAPAVKVPATKATATATASGTETPAPTKSLSPVQRLEELARDVARPSGGTVTVTGRDENVPSVDVRVRTAEGRLFELTVRFSDDADGVETGRQACRNDHQHPEDGRTCTTLRSTVDLGVWSREYVTHPGRESLWLVATARDETSLWVEFTNYVETPDGTKEIGPSWKDAGMTVSGLRKAVVRSGLTVVQN